MCMGEGCKENWKGRDQSLCDWWKRRRPTLKEKERQRGADLTGKCENRKSVEGLK